MNKVRLYYWLYVLSGFCLTGCMYKKEAEYTKIKSVFLDLSFVPEKLNFFFHKDSLYFYLYNYSTYKNLEIYNQNGTLVSYTDLGKLKLKTDRITIKMPSLDSIYIFSDNPAYLHLLNKKGVLLKAVKLDSLIYHKTEYNKERCKHLNFLFHGDVVKNKDLLLGLSIIDTSFKESQDLYENRLAANIQNRKNPNLLIIKNVLDTNCKVLLEPSWIGKTIKEQDDDFNMTPYYRFMKDKIIFCVPHDRHIYFAKASDLTFERKIPVFSEYAILEYKKPKLSREPSKVHNKPYVFYAMYKSAILDVYSENNKYFVLIKHETPLPEKEEMITLPDRFDAHYSVIVYNNEWKKEKEIVLPTQEILISFISEKHFVTQSKSKNPRNITLNFYQWTE